MNSLNAIDKLWIQAKRFIAYPPTRMVFASAMAVYSKASADHYGKQEEQAKERKEFILGLKKQVTAIGENFGCANRTDQTNLNCYCYGDDGRLNPARSNSQACKKFFGARPNLASRPDGQNPGGETDLMCVGAADNLDPSCECRGKNNCRKFELGRDFNPRIGAVIGEPINALNGLMGGDFTSQGIDAAKAQANAARMLETANKIANANPKTKKSIDRARLMYKKWEKDSTDKLEAHRSALNNAALGFGMGGSGDFGAIEGKLGEEMNKLIEARPTQAATVASVAPYVPPKAPKETGISDFSDGIEGVKLEESDYGAHDAKKLNLSDINNDTSDNIFTTLSNRYLTSGYERLFGDKARTLEPSALEGDAKDLADGEERAP